MIINTSRRAFLKRSFSSAALVAMAPVVPQFLLQASAAALDSGGDNILVVLQLSGGNDGLNTLVPYADDAYRASRPLLGVAQSAVLKIDGHVGLHPSMTGLRKLMDQGQLAIVQGVGYPNPNRSHFSSMDIWQTARNDADAGAGVRATGWLGRALQGGGANAGAEYGALHMASGSARLPLALVGDKTRALSVQSLDAFKLDDATPAIEAAIHEAAAASPDAHDGLVGFLHDASQSAMQSSRQVQEAVHHYKTETTYPDSGLGQRLKTVAQLIDAGLRPRIYYVELDGFDTHANQAAAHAGLLKELSAATAAFMQDLKQHGHDQRVLLMTFSEFGRRLHENASQGTDHGAAAPMFLAGGKVMPGLIGKHPSLTDLDDGDLKHTVDFRGVYAGVLENWLGLKSQPILGAAFDPVAVVKPMT